MRLFHETRINFYTNKSEVKICVLSDIHFSYQVTNKKLNAIVEKIRERKPNYIFIPGDLVDCNDMIKSEDEEIRLISWLKKLAELSTVIISRGNHDVYKKASKEYRKETGNHWSIFENQDFRTKLNSIENIHYLDNETYEDNNIFVLGLTQSPEYYNFFDKAKKVTIFNPVEENVDILLDSLDNINQKFITKLPKDKLKFILIHSPVHLNDYRVKAELEEFDYFISGHMHNGVVPPIIDEFWHSTKGIVSPTRNVFPKGIRNTIKTISDKSIVSGAITTWHECSGPMHTMNAFYPSYFMTLNFTKDKKYKRKPDVTKKYLNWN